MITFTLLNGDKLHVQTVDGYRKPDASLGDNPRAVTMIHALNQWYGVKENYSE